MNRFELASLDSVGWRSAYIPGQAEEFERMNDDPVEVGLPPVEAVPGGGGESVVIVVPTVPHRHDTEQ